MRKFFALAAALISGLFANQASAAPLYYLEVLGSTTGAAGSYSSSLDVTTPGTYFYEVVLTPAAVGASNAYTGGTTITSLTSADGASSLSFKVNDTAGTEIPVTLGNSALQNGFNGGTGAQPGTVIAGGTGIDTVRPILPNGQISGPNSVVVFTGTFTTGALAGGLSSALSVSWAGTGMAFKINNGVKTILAGTATETGADPILGYHSLSLTTAVSAVPEPASVVMMGLGFAGIGGLVTLRRRMARA